MTCWIAAAGVFVVSLDSMVNIAFPAIATAFRVPPEQLRWVIICYVGTYAVVSFVGGALADRIGHGRVFGVGLVLSGAGLLIVGTAPAFAWLLGGRVAQGFAAGLVYGTAPGLVTLVGPPETRGRALGFLNAGIGVAFSAGPVIAGALVEAWGWRSVFFVRIPLALVAFAWAAFGLPTARGGARHRLVRLRQILHGSVLHQSVVSFVANAGIFAIWLLAPFYLVERRGLGAQLGGVLFMLSPLGSTLAAPLGGRLADRLGPGLPTTAGLALEAAGLLLMSRVGATTPVPAIAAALFAAGLGLGFFQVPNMVSVMATFGREQQGAAGGLTFLARTLGTVGGVLTFAQIFGVRRPHAGFDAAFAEALLVSASAVAAAAALAAVPSGRPRGGETRPPP